MSFGTTIYRLKQEYGECSTLTHTEKLEVNPETGVQDFSEVETDLGVVIVLPSRIFAQSLMAFRTKEHPGGAFYLQHDTIGLIDRRNLLPSFVITLEDTITFVDSGEKYRIEAMLDFRGEPFIEVALCGLGKNDRSIN